MTFEGNNILAVTIVSLVLILCCLTYVVYITYTKAKDLGSKYNSSNDTITSLSDRYEKIEKELNELKLVMEANLIEYEEGTYDGDEIDFEDDEDVIEDVIEDVLEQKKDSSEFEDTCKIKEVSDNEQEETSQQEETPQLEEITFIPKQTQKCSQILVKGKNAGNQCGNETVRDSVYCKLHVKKN